MRKYSRVVLYLFLFVLGCFALQQHALASEDNLIDDEADLASDLLATEETEDPADGEVLSIPSPTNAGTLGKAVDLSSLPLTPDHVACLKSQGFKHLIQSVGFEVARDNLRIAAEGGMTVSAYKWLHWDYNITRQVKDALATIQGIIKNTDGKTVNVQRLWLDIEQDPADLSPGELEDLIQEAFTAVGYFPTGIYTSYGWWTSYMGGSTAFRNWPLWYAHYDCQRNFNDWFDGYDFGGWPSDGWTTPVGKQYAKDDGLNCALIYCNNRDLEVDQNWIYRYNLSGLPTPYGLSPADGTQIPGTQRNVRLSCDSNGGAVKYRFAVQYETEGGFKPYRTYHRTVNYVVFQFPYADTVYRWRVQYWNYYGRSTWTPWRTIEYGNR